MNDAAEQETCPGSDRSTLGPLTVVLVPDNPSSYPAQDPAQNGVVIENLGLCDQGRQRQQSRSDC